MEMKKVPVPQSPEDKPQVEIKIVKQKYNYSLYVFRKLFQIQRAD